MDGAEERLTKPFLDPQRLRGIVGVVTGGPEGAPLLRLCRPAKRRSAELIADLLPPGVLNIVNGFGLEAGKPLASGDKLVWRDPSRAAAPLRVDLRAADPPGRVRLLPDPE